MWLIPGKTKLKIELFKGVGIPEIVIGLVGAIIIALLFLSTLPGKYIMALIVFVIVVFLLLRTFDEPNYMMALNLLKFIFFPRVFVKEGISQGEEQKEAVKGKKGKSREYEDKAYDMEELCAFTGIEEDQICYDGNYFGAVIEIPAVEFRLYSADRKRKSIVNGVGKVLRSLNPDLGANIIKLERPVHYEKYRELEENKLEELRGAFEAGFLTEAELKARVEIIYDRIKEIDDLNEIDKVIVPFYYLVLFDSDSRRLENSADQALADLENGDLHPMRVTGKDLALFLRYTNEYDVNEEELDDLAPEDWAKWAMPDKVRFKLNTTEVNGIVTQYQKIIRYPGIVSDAWLATVMSVPGTRVIVKCKPMDLEKSVKRIDFALNELQAQYGTTGIESKRIELEQHIQGLSDLLVTLRGENETLLQTNIYVAASDLVSTENDPLLTTPENSFMPRITNIKKYVRRAYSENNFRLATMSNEQMKAFVAAQVSAYDPFEKTGRGIPGNSIAASYPWVFANVADEKGVKLGTTEDIPVFMDFFQRDYERVNSNLVIVGKSGSGKSYATKTLLANLAADDTKIFILDPENEYAELAANLHGKFINVANSKYGRLNPFHISTELDDDEEGTEGASASYSAHMQFLEEFFRQILPDCDKDALEYLNSLIERMYMDKGITQDTDLSKLRPSDYPIFDDLYDTILQEFQNTDNMYIRTMLRTLMNYVSKFASGGRNSNIWNGPSSVTTEENFTVFNFQSLLSNRNSVISNAQMLLVLKYIDNEIMKNRDYNKKHNMNRKIIVVIDEAHVFIDPKYPIALDFMFQLAKRIRKYNGMQIVITQNIKDFVGSEDIERKSSAIINACQYSFVFSLAPNDMDDLCKLYEKAGGINSVEQESILQAPRGQAFVIMGPQARTTLKVEAQPGTVSMFSDAEYKTHYFNGEEGQGYWEDYLQDSLDIHEEAVLSRLLSIPEEEEIDTAPKSFVQFEELEEWDEYIPEKTVKFEEFTEESTEESTEEPEFFDEFEDMDEESSDENNESSGEGEAIAAEIPAPPVQTVVQPEKNTKTEELLMELISKLSKENDDMRISRTIADEIDRQVNERMAGFMDIFKQLTEMQNAAAVTPVTPVVAPSDTTELEEEMEFAQEVEEPEVTELPDMGFDVDEEPEDAPVEEEEEPFFDILSLLIEESEKMNSESLIEQMEIYDDMVIETSLEDLSLYIKNLGKES